MAGDPRTTPALDEPWLHDERARYEALFDSLTGLPRGTLLLDRIAVALARARRHGTDVAVFVLEDPRFPTGAHDVKRVVEVLLSRLRPDDTLARIGSRRFAVVCNDIREDEDAAQVAHRLVLGSGLVSGLGIALGHEVDLPEALLGQALREAAAREPTPAA
jgi:GGDEF domain-containing protein